jgi:hypothetical protein
MYGANALARSRVDKFADNASKYKFCRNCVIPIQDEALSTKPLAYDRVLALDDKLRHHELPPLLQYQASIPAEHAGDAALIMWMRASFAIQIHCRASRVSHGLGALIVAQ